MASFVMERMSSFYSDSFYDELSKHRMAAREAKLDGDIIQAEESLD